MLVKKNNHKENVVAELVPIDHGFCLPEWMDDPYFEWLHWPQASIPFSESELEYISKLDPFRDAKLLRTELPLLRESSIRVLLVCTIFLKQAAAAGLCLADIGQMMTREFCGGEETPSEIENICLRVMSSIPYVCNNGKRKEQTENESKVFQFDNEKAEGSRDRSLSFSSLSHNCESGGLSFAGLNLSEWVLFLEIIEKLLPAVFEAKKRKK
ncbi:hypothetical protein K1719_027046 [Acacia pycnantha]|nr:hypothetical protein K1719_027046 [Acacia pycnantha]